MANYEAVIGLEVHAQLLTDSKIFATSSTTSGKTPNSQTDSVTLGLPGSLPVLNRRVVEFAIKIGLATNCTIQKESVFARKHYFYPDLPKGYQISQYDQPLCQDGFLDVRVGGEIKRIGLTRIHLEEDAGKNIHGNDGISYVDLNRAGVPLVEIVSEPDIRTAQEAGAYLRQMRQILRFTEVCDGNMEEGSMRCDANVSIRKVGATEFGTKVEIKNLNSFRFVERAIEHEIERQAMLLDAGETISQETRLFDDQKGVTKPMRSKEFAPDYRYFPDPDLPKMMISEIFDLKKIKEELPELPWERRNRYLKVFNIKEQDADSYVNDKKLGDFFEKVIADFSGNKELVQLASNYISSDLVGILSKDSKLSFPNDKDFAKIINMVSEGEISSRGAKDLLARIVLSGGDPEEIANKEGLIQQNDEGALKVLAEKLVMENPTVVADFKAGKEASLQFLVGQAMKVTKGSANPQVIKKILLSVS
jgi:aspartyl-tRNA(Asn)/glutamyl-tRNA(Gln) amidotransferase subunit B